MPSARRASQGNEVPEGPTGTCRVTEGRDDLAAGRMHHCHMGARTRSLPLPNGLGQPWTHTHTRARYRTVEIWKLKTQFVVNRK